ncbi:hypothetical protein HYT55_01105 [Candidatus Woesearchaeota archaeon]|nr:hypothetical protein [Candidatus Woesearchaeota archaeon]
MTTLSLSNLLLDGPNVAAGLYKGYMNAQGHDVDPTYLLYVGAGTSVAKGAATGGITAWLKSKRFQKKFDIEAERLKQINPPSKYALIDTHVEQQREQHTEMFGSISPVYEGTKRVAKSLPVAFLGMLVGYTIGYMSAKLIH